MRDFDRMAWRVTIGCLVCQMGLGLGAYVLHVFLKPIVEDFGWSRTAYSAAGGPLLLGLSCSSPLVGLLTERVGARAVFGTAITIVAAALVLLSFMTELWHFYALGLALGVGVAGLGDIPAGAVVSQWFTRRRGLVLGLVYTGSNIGGMIVPIVATEIAAVADWRVALRSVGVGGWLTIFPFAVWAVRERQSMLRESPESTSEISSEESLTLREALRTRSFWILFGVITSFYFYYVGVNHHLVAFLSDLGFSDAAAARRFGAAVGIGIAGKIGIGLVADRLPKRLAILVNFGVMTIGSLMLLTIGTTSVVVVPFLLIHGFTVAAENVTVPLAIADCFGPKHLAKIYGAIMLALLPGGILGPVFAGHVFDTTGSYATAFAVFAVVNLVALVALTGLRSEAAGAR